MNDVLFKCAVCKTGSVMEVSKRKIVCNNCGTTFLYYDDPQTGPGYQLFNQPKEKAAKKAYRELTDRYPSLPAFKPHEWNSLAEGGKTDKEKKVEEEARQEQERIKRLESIIITTSSYVEGRPVKEYKDIVGAQVVSGINVFKDIFAGLRNIVGGRSDALQNSMREMRVQALTELKQEAFLVGANAVVGIKLDFDEYSEHMLMLTATGTAVLI